MRLSAGHLYSHCSSARSAELGWHCWASERALFLSPTSPTRTQTHTSDRGDYRKINSFPPGLLCALQTVKLRQMCIFMHMNVSLLQVGIINQRTRMFNVSPQDGGAEWQCGVAETPREKIWEERNNRVIKRMIEERGEVSTNGLKRRRRRAAGRQDSKEVVEVLRLCCCASVSVCVCVCG